MLPLLGSRALRHIRNDGPACHGASDPAACHVQGLGTPFAASTVVPPDAFRRRSVPRLHPSRRSPRDDRCPFRSTLPSWRFPRRFASPPWGACGRGRIQGFDPVVELVLPFRIPKDPARRCLLGFRPSRAFPLLGLRLRFGSRGIPSHALGGLTSQPACVTGCSGSRRSAVPSRGCRLSWAFSPSDRHGTAGIGAGGGLMASPHGSRALQAARTDLSPLASPTRPRLSPRPGAAVHR
jgi:hypothetical protein